MVLLDVNVLVYAHRRDSRRHRDYLGGLQDLIASDAAYGSRTSCSAASSGWSLTSGSEWITADRDYHRFPGLRVRHPLE